MSIIVNGTEIPTNGDYIDFNGIKVTKIICNDVVVWEQNLSSTDVDFAYTGEIKEWIVPVTGLYKLEVWGARGGNANGITGGKGGYALGYKKLIAGTKLYIVCGGSGKTAKYGTSAVAGGYNGGGTGGCVSWEKPEDTSKPQICNRIGGSGGGASHIALATGLLSELESDTSNILIVAGGAGGASYYDSEYNSKGGNGGTTTGKNTKIGQGGNATVTTNDAIAPSGGGSGWFSGKSGGSNSGLSASYGGDNNISNVPSLDIAGVTYAPVSESGNNNSSGKAKISLITELAVDADPSTVSGVSVGTYSFTTGDWDVYISRSLSACISGIDASLYKGIQYYVSRSNSRQNHRGCNTYTGLCASCTDSTQVVEQRVNYHGIGWDEDETEWSLTGQTLTLSWEDVFVSGTVNITIGCLGVNGHGQSLITITNCVLLAR